MERAHLEKVGGLSDEAFIRMDNSLDLSGVPWSKALELVSWTRVMERREGAKEAWEYFHEREDEVVWEIGLWFWRSIFKVRLEDLRFLFVALYGEPYE